MRCETLAREHGMCEDVNESSRERDSGLRPEWVEGGLEVGRRPLPFREAVAAGRKDRISD